VKSDYGGKMPSRGAGHPRLLQTGSGRVGKRRAGVVLGVVETKTLLKANRLLVGKDWLFVIRNLSLGTDVRGVLWRKEWF
jgi:hypothetical protein